MDVGIVVVEPIKRVPGCLFVGDARGSTGRTWAPCFMVGLCRGFILMDGSIHPQARCFCGTRMQGRLPRKLTWRAGWAVSTLKCEGEASSAGAEQWCGSSCAHMQAVPGVAWMCFALRSKRVCLMLHAAVHHAQAAPVLGDCQRTEGMRLLMCSGMRVCTYAWTVAVSALPLTSQPTGRDDWGMCMCCAWARSGHPTASTAP